MKDNLLIYACLEYLFVVICFQNILLRWLIVLPRAHLDLPFLHMAARADSDNAPETDYVLQFGLRILPCPQNIPGGDWQLISLPMR